MNPLSLLFPTRCMLCHAWLEQDTSMLCPACATKVRSLRLASPLSLDGVQGSMACFCYTGEIRRALIAYKFSHQKRIAPWFAAQACALMMTQGWKLDAITFVPTSASIRWQRGYDQSEVLARYIGKQLDLPVCKTLHKSSWVHKQSRLSAEKRADNVQTAYTLHRNTTLEGKHLLLVDDIFTTGATMRQCTGLLTQAGAHVYALALAFTPKK